MHAVTAFGLTALLALCGCRATPDGAEAARRQTVARLTRLLDQPPPAADQVAARDSVARERANAAAALVARGGTEPAWTVFRHSADPGSRSYLIHAVGRIGPDPRVILRRLEQENDVSARRALVLSLGEFTAQQIPDVERQRAVATLLCWYRDDPDPGMHAAVDWLLRHGRQGERARRLDWRARDSLERIDRELAGGAPGRRDWYVTRELHTMTIVRGPVEVRMGSPAHEVGRTPDETQRRVRIQRSFAIASTEVTIAQFRRFLDANPDVKRRHGYPGDEGRMEEVLRQFSPDDDGPQIAVTWYEAAAYCNWLSTREGIPESEWVYPSAAGTIAAGMRMPNDYLRKTGYRLPTEAEWEYAARAGSTTARFYGDAAAPLLKEYAWHRSRAPTSRDDPLPPGDPDRTWPVGQLKPNDLGLFDVYGNVWEWLHDRRREFAPGDTLGEDREDIVLTVSDSVARTRRGGSFSYEPAMHRSAHRGSTNYFPAQRRDNVGFRVARTFVRDDR